MALHSSVGSKVNILTVRLLCGASILACGAERAQAQVAAIPPLHRSIDENGVDLTSGEFVTPPVQVSIGPKDNPMIYERSFRGNLWRSNFEFYINITDLGLSHNVVLGDRTEKFVPVLGQLEPSFEYGSKLVKSGTNYTYTAKDGTVVFFDGSAKDQTGFLVNTYYDAMATEILSPNGIKTKISYRTDNALIPASRIQSISRSDGYQIKLRYADDSSLSFSNITNWKEVISATAINNVYDRCYPENSDSCSAYTQAWPSISISRASSGGNTTVASTDNLGRTMQIVSNVYGGIVSVKRPGASVPSTLLSAAPKVSSITKDGFTYSYNFWDQTDKRTVVVTTPAGGTRTIESSISMAKITSYKDELNRITTYTYDPAARLTLIQYPEGNKVQYSYDSRGNVVEMRQISKTPGTPPDIVATAGFDANCSNIKTCNQPNWTKDAKANQTDYTYDPTHGGVLTVTSPSAMAGGTRPQARSTYAAFQAYFKNGAGAIAASGQPHYLLTATSECQSLTTCANAADEVKTTFAYGSQTPGVGNNLLSTSVSTGAGDGSLLATTAYAYDRLGFRVLVDGPLPGSADLLRNRFDIMGQVVGVVQPDPDGTGAILPSAQRITYNADGQITQSELGLVNDDSEMSWLNFNSQQQELTIYDANARAVRTETKSGSTTYAVTQTNYDNFGRVNCVVQRMDPAQWGGQTDACTPQTTGPNGPDRVTKTLYNTASEITSVQKGVGTPAFAVESTLTYRPNGKLATLKDAKNNLTTYEYDGLDRLLKTRYPLAAQGSNASSTTDYEQFTYDANSNITQRRLRDGQFINLAYDNLNRVTVKDLPSPDLDISFGYDLLGRNISASQTGHNLSFTYDALGHLLTETGPLGTMTSQYDVRGRRTGLIWPDSAVTTYNYDTLGRVKGIYEGIGTSVWMNTYSYDSLGRRTRIYRRFGAHSTFSYDAISRLTRMTHNMIGAANDIVIDPITYNPANQIKSLTRSNDSYAFTGRYNVNRLYVANGLNQLTSAGAVALGYDARGNLTSSGSDIYSYTSENRMKSGPGVTLSYDPLGRLYEVTQGANTTRFQYDGLQIAAEYNGANTRLRRYVPGPGLDEPAFWYEGSGIGPARWYHADERGSVIAVSDATGAAIGINKYDEFGIPAATNIGRFQFTGQTWLPELGLYNYKARLYSPTLGRFMQTDPIGYGDGPNLYAYAGNDPVNFGDPMGTDGEPMIPMGANLEAGTIVVTGKPADTGQYLITSAIGNSNFGFAQGLSGYQGVSILASSASRGGQQRGDPGRTSTPDGSGNPDKKFKPGKKPGTRIFNDPTTGKPKVKAWPEDGRLGGDGSGVHPGSKYPDGTPVKNKSTFSASSITAGIAVFGAGLCFAIEPCGAAVASLFAVGGLVAAGQ